ncbi:CBS domain-containing protein [Streptomyces sannanensis]|uniref:CBS domain-containing protein n=1 Tax=Streptomyces sannanensis TaxID=285536 RepID=A0ABP6SL92_9ACTN
MKHCRVGNLMVDEVVSVTPSAPFKDVAKLLAEHDISGLPVLDDDDRVLGVVSESDLLVRQASAGQPEPEPNGPRHAGQDTPGTARWDALTATQLMSAPAVTVRAQDTVAEAARTMIRRGVERLPVVDEEDRLVGIVTRRDLLKVFLRPDREIRQRVIEDVLLDTMRLAPDAVAVHVLDGVVTLEGQLEKSTDIHVVRRLTERIDGVVSVADHLTARVDDSRTTPSDRTADHIAW